MVSAEWVTAAGTAMAGLATLIAGWAAIRGVDAWRSELVGRRKAELAEDVLAQFYRARDVITWARLPARPLDAAPQPDDADQRHQSHASPIERLTHESALFSELQASRYRFMAYFGQASAHPFEEMREIHGDVISSAQSLIRDPNEHASDAERDRWEDAIGWIDDGDDPLAARLAATIASVERVCRPLIADQHRFRPRAEAAGRAHAFREAAGHSARSPTLSSITPRSYPMTDAPNAPIVKALFVRLIAQDGKADAVEQFLRDGLAAVMEEPDTTSWYAVRFGQQDFAIFDTFPSDEGRMSHLAGKVGSALVARTPELLVGTPTIEHADVLAYKLPQASGQVPG